MTRAGIETVSISEKETVNILDNEVDKDIE